MLTKPLAALTLVGVLALGASAADPEWPDAKAFDKLVSDSLRAVHDRGADLYNESKDFTGTYRVYQGALLAVRPLLGHRPDAQKLIDLGFEAAEKETDPARKAFTLHETIEAVRKNLKKSAAPQKPDQPETPARPVAPAPRPVKPKR